MSNVYDFFSSKEDSPSQSTKPDIELRKSAMLSTNAMAHYSNRDAAKAQRYGQGNSNTQRPQENHATRQVEASNEPWKQWIAGYKGNFDFFVSLQRQYNERGSLSPRQIECIEKAMNYKPQAIESSLKENTTLVVSKFYAGIVGKETGLPRPHYAVNVLKVLAETPKAYQVTVKLSAQRTSHCCVCGRTLTDGESVRLGIGPICAEKYNVESLEQLATQLETVDKTVTLWIPKSQIKEKQLQLTHK